VAGFFCLRSTLSSNAGIDSGSRISLKGPTSSEESLVVVESDLKGVGADPGFSVVALTPKGRAVSVVSKSGSGRDGLEGYE